jgi:hypothetical protein
MKKIRNLVLFAVMVSLGSLFLISCGTGGDGGGSPYSVLGIMTTDTTSIGLRAIWIVKNGKIDFSNYDQPITGESWVTDATVTISNETLGTSEVVPFDYGGYFVSPTFPIIEGNRISVRIEIDSDTITGDSTLVPNPIYYNLGPAVATLPFTASWEVAYLPPSYEASQTAFEIMGQTTDEGCAVIIPISQTSIQLTSALLSPGQYEMMVMGGNPMNLSGAASGSIIYAVGGVPAEVDPMIIN